MTTFKDDMTTDLDVFIDSEEFGSSVIYTASGESAVTIEGIFDENFPAQNSDGVIIPTVKLRVKTSDVPSPTKNDTMAVDGTTYYAMEWTPNMDEMRDIFLSLDQVDQ